MTIKISQMTAGGVLAGTELLPMVQSGANYSTTPLAIKTYILGQSLNTFSGSLTLVGLLKVGRGGVSLPSIKMDDLQSGFYWIAADNWGWSAGGTKVLDMSANGVFIKGTNTNDAAAAGFVGQYIESVVATVAFPTTTQQGDVTSISLTAGDWDVTIILHAIANGATVAQMQAGISITSGNSTTGLVLGSNRVIGPGPTSTNDDSLVVANYRMSLATTTTVYGKFAGVFSVAVPQANARLSARRVR